MESNSNNNHAMAAGNKSDAEHALPHYPVNYFLCDGADAKTLKGKAPIAHREYRKDIQLTPKQYVSQPLQRCIYNFSVGRRKPVTHFPQPSCLRD
jgi:hypothetical protein